MLREQVGIRSVKDGCSPQGQCGCCTVLVDGAPRVSCVTPAAAGRRPHDHDARRVRPRRAGAVGRSRSARPARASAASAPPGSSCGLEALRARGVEPGDHAAVEQALLAHLCRCTGWRTILDAYDLAASDLPDPRRTRDRTSGRWRRGSRGPGGRGAAGSDRGRDRSAGRTRGRARRGRLRRRHGAR